MTEDERVAALTADMLRCEAPVEMVLRPVSALQLVGFLQLALRHPDANGPAAHTARVFIDHVRTYFKDHDATAVLEVIRLGDDPRHDRRRTH